jgi:hypothetical protein
MSRTADYSIQGFMYQFILTLHKLLQITNNNSEIIIEGPIEDIDLITPIGIEAIQCKYHETKDKFTLSTIYKPVLQMMTHYSKNSSKNIKYRLYAHFPNELVGSKKNITEADISQILKSKSQDYKTLIRGLKGFSDTSGFISKFEMEFGHSLSDLEKAVIVSLSNEGFSTEDAKEIFYPNAIHKIAELSIKHNDFERKISKDFFLENLKEKKKTAISRWTKELQCFEKLLKKRREQLRDNLNKNSRVRAIILDSKYINDFDSKIVQLIEDFINKYNCKIKLHHCPIFSIISDNLILNSIWRRLNIKSISVERGMIAGEFDVNYFLREPLKIFNEGKAEFKMKLCSHESDFEKIFSDIKLDDLYIISDKEFHYLDNISDINIEKIQTKEINEIKYLLLLNDKL